MSDCEIEFEENMPSLQQNSLAKPEPSLIPLEDYETRLILHDLKFSKTSLAKEVLLRILWDS